MYRLFRMASQLKGAVQILSSSKLSVVGGPVMQPSRFFMKLPVPSVIQRELRAAIASNCEAMRRANFLHEYRQIQGDKFSKRDVKLSDRELLAIDLVIEQIRKKYGMRELTANDTWDPILIRVVTHPEEWIRAEVQEKGKCLEEALIFAAKYLAPKAPCTNLEDLMEMISFKNPAPSKINQSTNLLIEENGADTDRGMKPS